MQRSRVKVWVYEGTQESANEEEFFTNLEHPIEKLVLFDLLASDLCRSPAFARALCHRTVEWLAEEVRNVDWGLQCAVILYNAAVNQHKFSLTAIKTIAEVYDVLDPRDPRLPLIFHTIAICLSSFHSESVAEFVHNFRVRSHESLYLNLCLQLYVKHKFQLTGNVLKFFKYAAFDRQSHLALLALLNQPRTLLPRELIRYFRDDDFRNPEVFTLAVSVASGDRQLFREVYPAVLEYLNSLPDEELTSTKISALLEKFPPSSTLERRIANLLDLHHLVTYVRRNPKLLDTPLLQKFLRGTSGRLDEVVALAAVPLVDEPLLLRYLDKLVSAKFPLLIRALEFYDVISKHLTLIVAVILLLKSDEEFVVASMLLANFFIMSKGTGKLSEIEVLVPRLIQISSSLEEDESLGAMYVLALLKTLGLIVTLPKCNQATSKTKYFRAWLGDDSHVLKSRDLKDLGSSFFTIKWQKDPSDILKDLQFYKCVELGRRALIRPIEVTRTLFSRLRDECDQVPSLFWSIAAASTQWTSLHTKILTSDFLAVAAGLDINPQTCPEFIEALLPLLAQSASKLLAFAPALFARYVQAISQAGSTRTDVRFWGVIIPRVVPGILEAHSNTSNAELKSVICQLVGTLLTSASSSAQLRINILKTIRGEGGFSQVNDEIISNLSGPDAGLTHSAAEFLLHRNVEELQSYSCLPGIALKALQASRDDRVCLSLARLFGKLVTPDALGCEIALRDHGSASFGWFVDVSVRSPDSARREVVETLLESFGAPLDALYCEESADVMQGTEANSTTLVFMGRRSTNPGIVECIFTAVLARVKTPEMMNALTSLGLWYAHLQKLQADKFRLVEALVRRVQADQTLWLAAASADGLFRVVISLCEAKRDLIGLVFVLLRERKKRGVHDDDTPVLKLALKSPEPVQSCLLSLISSVAAEEGIKLVLKHTVSYPLLRLNLAAILSEETARNAVLNNLTLASVLGDLAQDALLSTHRGLNILGLLLTLHNSRPTLVIPDQLRVASRADNLLSRLLLMLDATRPDESGEVVDASLAATADAGTVRSILALSRTFPLHFLAKVTELRDPVADKLMLRFYLNSSKDSDEIFTNILQIALRSASLPQVDSSVLGYLAMTRLLKWEAPEQGWEKIKKIVSSDKEFVSIASLSLMLPSGAVRRSCLLFLAFLVLTSGGVPVEKILGEEAAVEGLRGDDRSRLLTLLVLGGVAERGGLGERTISAVSECIHDRRLRVHAIYVLYKCGWQGGSTLQYTIKVPVRSERYMEDVTFAKMCFLSQLVCKKVNAENSEFFSLLCLHTAKPVQSEFSFFDFLIDRRLKRICTGHLIRALASVTDAELIKADMLGAQEALHAITQETDDEVINRKACLLLSQVAIAASRAALKRHKLKY